MGNCIESVEEKKIIPFNSKIDLPMLEHFQQIDIWYFWLQLSKIPSLFFFPSDLAMLFFQYDETFYNNSNNDSLSNLSQK